MCTFVFMILDDFGNIYLYDLVFWLHLFIVPIIYGTSYISAIDTLKT